MCGWMGWEPLEPSDSGVGAPAVPGPRPRPQPTTNHSQIDRSAPLAVRLGRCRDTRLTLALQSIQPPLWHHRVAAAAAIQRARSSEEWAMRSSLGGFARGLECQRNRTMCVPAVFLDRDSRQWMQLAILARGCLGRSTGCPSCSRCSRRHNNRRRRPIRGKHLA